MRPRAVASPSAMVRAAAWLAVAGLFAAIAVIGHAFDPAALDWRPDLAWRQPWRAFTAIGVHYSAFHLAANLVGALLTAALGVAAEVTPRAAVAWLAAWPLTQFGLWSTPELLRFGGLSGVLHAGVLVVAVALIVQGPAGRRSVGVALVLGCAAKLVAETAWAPPWLRHPAGWDIATAPIAHLTGCAAGLACGLIAAPWSRPSNRSRFHA